MEMESSRRSIDRSREPGLKKPRLVEELERDLSSNGIIDRGRPFPQRVSARSATNTSNGQIQSRVRANEREREAERDDTGRNVQLQQQLQHSHQEIVSEYKSALAELTFNSKPIITNLTIIAGENLHAAKWIAATVCSHILEVPTEQKLPSLYLLDSIVKNIGRDYIRYFASRLPEVFCKVYRQVDASMHTSMRHLFGTWKGVFPPTCLQMIEQELGFTSAMNVSSSGGLTSRPDSQSQRPANSIHVNPKYLEARQRLQQSNRAKRDDSASAVVASVDDAVMPDRTANIGRGRPWADQPAKHLNRDPRLAQREPVHEKKTGIVYDDNQYGSDLPRHSDLKIGRGSERVIEQGFVKPFYAAGGNAADEPVSQRNAFNSTHGFANHRTPRSSQVIAQLRATQSTANRSSSGEISGNWKNFEEEEYSWDDMKSRLRDHDGTDSSSKDTWTPENDEKPEIEDSLLQPHSEHDMVSKIKRETSTDSLSITQRRQGAFGHQTSSTWAIQEPHSVNSLNHKEIPTRYSAPSDRPSTILGGLTSMSSAMTGLQSLTGPSAGAPSTFGSLVNTVPGSGGLSGQKRHQPLRPVSPSGLSEPDKKISKLAGQFNRAPHNQTIQDSFPILPQSHLHHPPRNSQLNQSQPPQNIKGPSPLLNQDLRNSSNPSDITGQLSKGNLLAAIMKSGLLSQNSTGGTPNLDFQDSHSHIQPPLPSGSPRTQLSPSSASMIPPALALEASSRDSKSSPSLTTHPKKTLVPPPLPPGPPPSSSVQTSNRATAVENPLSSLLNTLVVKGLISTPAKESSNLTSTQVLSQLPDQNPPIATMPMSSSPASSIIPLSSPGNELPSSASTAKSITTLPQATMTEIKDLIGFEFKPEIIRQLHPLVVSDLFDDLPHRCSICGLRLKLQERLERHLEWHALKTREASSTNSISRRWYLSSVDWVSETTGLPSGPTSVDELVDAEDSEPEVPADESQCACLLCGELFEDFYSHERDRWMYKGAVYMTIPAAEGKTWIMDERSSGGLIVHARCISPSSVYELGLAKNVKLEDQTDV